MARSGGPMRPLPLLLCLGAVAALRRGELGRERKKDIYFLHIPRTAGTSFISDARLSLNTFRNNMRLHYDFEHMEGCYAWRNQWPENDPPLMAMMIRRPRQMVYSEYLLCAEGPVSIMAEVPQPDKDGFKWWIHSWHEYLKEGKGVGDFSNHIGLKPQLTIKLPVTYTTLPFECYNPANMMSQRLTCELPYKYPESIDGDLAVRHMREAWFVGLPEVYQESICLFRYKVYAKLPKFCNCEDRASWDEFAPKNTSYHEARLKSAPLAEQDERTIAQIDNMTVLDTKLYEAAAERFQREMQEVHQKTGTKVLCRKLPPAHEKMGRKVREGPPPRPVLQLSEDERREVEEKRREWVEGMKADGRTPHSALMDLMKDD